MHPKSHRKFKDFFIDVLLDFGIVLGGNMLTKSDQKSIKFGVFFEMVSESKMLTKREPK